MRGFRRQCEEGAYREHVHSHFGQGVRSVKPSSSKTILSSLPMKDLILTMKYYYFVIRFTTAISMNDEQMVGTATVNTWDILQRNLNVLLN